MKKCFLVFALVIIHLFCFANPKIYLCGTIKSNSNYLPYYWVNGKTVILQGGEAPNGASADAIAVKGEDVFITGRYWNGQENLPCYWINEEKVNLSIEGNNYTSGQATAIAFRDSDIVIAGSCNEKNKSYPCYWLNKERVDLQFPDNGTLGAGSQAICISDNDIYICGANHRKSTGLYACYWKNNNYYQLDIGDAKKAVANSIFVKNGRVIICGTVDSKGGSAFFWDNGKVSILENSICALDMFVDSSDIYILGANSKHASCYWKNGKSYDIEEITDPEKGYDLRRLWIDNGKLYFAGAYTWDQGYSRQGVYWVGNKPILLGGNVITVDGIFLVNTK